MADNELLVEFLRQQSASTQAMRDDLHDINDEITKLKVEINDLRNQTPYTKHGRLMDTTKGGSLGAVLISILYGIVEFFKSQGS